MFCEEKSVTYYQRKLIDNYVADGVKGPKEEMREKVIKRILDEVFALAEICGGMLVHRSIANKYLLILAISFLKTSRSVQFCKLTRNLF